jgi:hypothetical protein
VADFNLKPNPNDIPGLASRYNDPYDAAIEDEVAPRVRRQGRFSKPDFLRLCAWKTPRSKPLCATNSEEYIEEITRVALSTPSEQLRIEVLTLLRGVSWPTASAILHFGWDNMYPILDFRALWSVGIDVRSEGASKLYRFPFWIEYTSYCRNLADSVGVNMRTLDRALWQYSKENQD